MGVPNNDQHETSQKSIPPFTNDWSSDNEMIMRRKERESLSAAALAAKEAQEKLERTKREETEAAARELQTLKAEKAEVERLKSILQSQYTALEAEKSKLQSEKEVLTKTGEVLKNNLEKELRITKSSLQSQLDKILPSENCLDPKFHNQVVRIINPNANVAIDFGYDNNTTVVGHENIFNNANQILRLEKTDQSDPKSPWLIRRNDKSDYMEFRNNDSNSKTYVNSRRSGSDQTWQHWYIGHFPEMPVGTYFIRNRKFDCDVRVSGWSNGSRCFPYSKSEPAVDHQHWVICLQRKHS